MGITVEVSHRQKCPSSEDLSGKEGRVNTCGVHRTESRVFCKQDQYKSQCSECTDAAVLHDCQPVLSCPAASHAVGDVRQPIFMEAAADDDKICEHEDNRTRRREDGKRDVTE